MTNQHSQPVSDRVEPRTEAGRRLRSRLDRLDYDEAVFLGGWDSAIRAIEEEAAALAHSSPVLDELRALSEAATPGRWLVPAGDDDIYNERQKKTIARWMDPEDSAFIVAAVNYVRSLLSDPTEPDRTEEEPR